MSKQSELTNFQIQYIEIVDRSPNQKQTNLKNVQEHRISESFTYPSRCIRLHVLYLLDRM